MIDKVQKFKEIVTEMADLYEKKNSNYGDSFSKLYKDLGPVAGLVPLHNKLDRATNLVKGAENNFESLEDTFKDLACYAIMNLIELISAKDKQLEEWANHFYTAVDEEVLSSKSCLKVAECNDFVLDENSEIPTSTAAWIPSGEQHD